MTKLRVTLILTTSVSLVLPACSGSSEGPSPSAGGATTMTAGGATNPSNGGQSNGVGGNSQQGGGVARGGATAGGAPGGMGGAIGNGGNAQLGGSTANIGGGSSSGGGTATTGGTTATGGKGGVASGGRGGTGTTGGAATTGGITSSGGAATTGGITSSGGKSTGGSSANGGTTNTGACVESTCGSHKWPCWRMPTPPSENLPNAQSYTDLGNGAVRDNVTCLVWEKANPATQGNWQASADRCAALASSNHAGFSDWRLPTRVEMASITDVTLGSRGFPSVFTTTSGYYTTKSYWYKTILSPGTTNMVWGYGTNGFTSNAIVRTGSNLVARCVRGNGTGEAYDTYAAEPPNHYTVTGTGTNAVVKDNYTGLTWQQGYSSSRMAWSAAASYCASQTTGGMSDWRLPTLTELASTVNEALVAPAINRTVFPSTNGSCDPDGWFWAAEASKVGGQAWGLSYCDGYTGWNAGADSSAWNYFVDGWVRCVHN